MHSRIQRSRGKNTRRTESRRPGKTDRRNSFLSTPPFTSSFRSSVSWRQTIAIFILFMLVCGGLIAWGSYHATYHYAVVQDGVLYRDGSRSIHELNNAVSRANPKTVISLIDDQELHDPAKPQFQEEEADMSARGIAYQRIAVKLGGWPTSEDIRQFLNAMEDASRQPVLIHCARRSADGDVRRRLSGIGARVR